MPIARAMNDFVSYKKNSTLKEVVDAIRDKGDVAVERESVLSGLNCDAFGGPPREKAQEMVYWSDIPSDSQYVSPFHEKRGQHRRYLTFEPGKDALLFVLFLSLPGRHHTEPL